MSRIGTDVVCPARLGGLRQVAVDPAQHGTESAALVPAFPDHCRTDGVDPRT